MVVLLLGCGAGAIAEPAEETGDSETGDASELGEVAWIYESDVHPDVLEVFPSGLLVGGRRPVFIEPDWPSAEADVFELSPDGERVWTAMWDPEQSLPRRIHALAWDEARIWVGFDTVAACFDWCPSSWLARLDPLGGEMWRVELSQSATTRAIRTIDLDAIVVGIGEGEPGAEVHRVDASGEVIWEWVFDADSQSIYATGIEPFEGALWVVGVTQASPWWPGAPEPWIVRLDPDTGVLLEVLDTQLPAGALWSATVLPTGLAVVGDERLWVLDGSGDWVWTRGLAPTDDWDFCRFDARADGHSASACENFVQLLDANGQPLWSFAPEEPEGWSDVALGDRLFLADGAWGVPDVPGRVLALQID
jgi:hypothetical protein